MAANGTEGPAAMKGGFAGRAIRWADCASNADEIKEESRIRGARNAEKRRSRPPLEEMLHAAPSRATTQQHQNPRRMKRLALIAAASVAVTFMAIAYSLWTSTTSRVAVENATAGAAPTLVATADIRAGDVLTSDMVVSEQVPRSFRATAALDGEALNEGGAAVGSRALVDIPAGSQITPSLVTGVRGAGHLSAELQPGMEAVTVAVDTETGLAGQVRVYDTLRVVSAESASSGASLLETVCERARVVAVGEGADASEAQYASVTVEVSPSEANAVREAQYAGRVSLILVASNDVLEEGAERG